VRSIIHQGFTPCMRLSSLRYAICSIPLSEFLL
jgi:hypothetical protein